MVTGLYKSLKVIVYTVSTNRLQDAIASSGRPLPFSPILCRSQAKAANATAMAECGRLQSIDFEFQENSVDACLVSRRKVI